MKKTQPTTNLGVLALFGGFLAIFQDVKVMDFMDVFSNLTYGQIVTMVMPFITGITLMFHDEDKK